MSYLVYISFWCGIGLLVGGEARRGMVWHAMPCFAIMVWKENLWEHATLEDLSSSPTFVLHV